MSLYIAYEAVNLSRAFAELYGKPDTSKTVDISGDVPAGFSLIQLNSSGIWVVRDSNNKMVAANQNRSEALIAASRILRAAPASPDILGEL
jgi:hypothetical protein